MVVLSQVGLAPPEALCKGAPTLARCLEASAVSTTNTLTGEKRAQSGTKARLVHDHHDDDVAHALAGVQIAFSGLRVTRWSATNVVRVRPARRSQKSIADAIETGGGELPAEGFRDPAQAFAALQVASVSHFRAPVPRLGPSTAGGIGASRERRSLHWSRSPLQ